MGTVFVGFVREDAPHGRGNRVGCVWIGLVVVCFSAESRPPPAPDNSGGPIRLPGEEAWRGLTSLVKESHRSKTGFLSMSPNQLLPFTSTSLSSACTYHPRSIANDAFLKSPASTSYGHWLHHVALSALRNPTCNPIKDHPSAFGRRAHKSTP